MAVEFTFPTLDELPRVVALANRVFRPGGGDMGTAFPFLYNPQNLEQLRIARVGGEIVSHVGIAIRDASLLGAPVRVAAIGSVATDEAHRGKGYASQLMADALHRSREDGASLMLISGGRGLYHRLGYVHVGEFVSYTSPAGDAPGDLTLEVVPPERWREAAVLHQREGVRFRRSGADWEALLRAGVLLVAPADLLLIRAGGEALAYAGVQRPRGERLPHPRVQEIAGARALIAEALPAIARHYDSARAEVIALASDVGLRCEAVRRGWERQRRAFGGTVGVIDPPRFLAAIEPLLAERAGDAFRLEPDGEGALIVSDVGSHRLPTRGHLTAVLFGGDTDEARTLGGDIPIPLRERLATALPLPLFG